MGRLAAGDLSAFDGLYERHRRPVFSVLLRLTRDRALAEEILQETFLRLYAHRADYRAEGRFRPWLYTIARNLLTDHYRRGQSSPGGETAQLEDPIGPAEWAEAGELAARLEGGVRRLPPTQREVLLLTRVGGLTTDEVARVTDSTPGAVRVALHRALQALRSAIAPPG